MRSNEKTYIYGKHALTEALMNVPQVVQRVFISQEANQDPELRALLRKHHINPTFLRGPNEAARMVGRDTAHQGVIGVANVADLVIDFRSFLQKIAITPHTSLVLLDELTDPHNVGAIIRSAAAFGVSGILLPSRNQAPITGAVIKTSAGMVFRIPIIEISSVNQTVRDLKKEGFRAYALAMEGARDVAKEKFDAPSVFIIGNEGAGIRQKTLEYSDASLKIAMHPGCESLNASVSAAVVLYAWSAQHQDALRS